MNLMLKYIKFRKVRFILAGLGLGLLLGMVVAMGGIEGGMNRDATVFAQSTGTDLWVSQQDSGGPFLGQSGLPRGTVQDVAAIAGVAQASPLVFGSYTIPEGEGFKRVMIVGTEQDGLGGPTSLASGRLYRSEQKEVVADEGLGLALGDRLDLGADEYEVAGLTQGMNYSTVPIIYLALAEAQDILFSQQEYPEMMEEVEGKFFATFTTEEGTRIRQRMDELIPEWMELTGNINAVLVKLKDGYALQTVAEDVEQSLELDVRTQAEELNLIVNSEVKTARDQMIMFKTMLMIVAGVIVMLITFANTIEKTKDIAILKAVGTPTRRIMGTVVQEAVLVGIVGAVVGSILITLMAPMFPMPLLLRTEDITVVFVGAFILCALGSLLGVRKILSIDPMVAMGR
ncbi:MAG: ABC transporter permease [Anaerolineae bacterium]